MGLLANQPSLEDQIRQQWGKYGDWNAAGLDQVAAFAKLLRENGITDLGQLEIKAREYSLPDTVEETEANGPQTVRGRSGTAFDVFYGGEQRGFLGDINRDGSITAYKPQYWDELTRNEDGTFTNRLGTRASSNLHGDGNLLGWSAQGRGNTSFYIAQGPDGKPVVVPVWGSSRQNDYETARGIASVLLSAAGAQLAAAGGSAGQIGTGMLQGQGAALAGNVLMNPEGDVDSMAKSSIGGSISGGIGAGAKVLGSNMGWNPSVTKAVTSAGMTAARGGDAEDILRSGAASGFSDYMKTEGLTGSATVDKALGGAGSALIAGKSGQDALISAVNSALSGGSGRNNADASRGGDALDQDMPEGGGGGDEMGDDWGMDDWLTEGGINFSGGGTTDFFSALYPTINTTSSTGIDIGIGGLKLNSDYQLPISTTPNNPYDVDLSSPTVSSGGVLSGGIDPTIDLNKPVDVIGGLDLSKPPAVDLTNPNITSNLAANNGLSLLGPDALFQIANNPDSPPTNILGELGKMLAAMGLTNKDLLTVLAGGTVAHISAEKQKDINNAVQTALTERQNSQNTFLSNENEKTRTFTADQNKQNRDQVKSLQDDQQLFTSGENTANRKHLADMQTSQQTFTSGENTANRKHLSDMQEDQQLFTSGENDKTRAHTTAERLGKESFEGEQNQLKRDWEDADREDTQEFDLFKITDERLYKERLWRENQARMANGGKMNNYKFTPRRGLLG